MDETTAERIVVLSRKLMDLGLRPDDPDDYDEFERVVLQMCDALEAAEAEMKGKG